MPERITYRGPRVLVGALAHLLREEGVEFDQPPGDRTEVVEVAVVVLAVRAGNKVLNRSLDAMIEAGARGSRSDRRRYRVVEITDDEDQR